MLLLFIINLQKIKLEYELPTVGLITINVTVIMAFFFVNFDFRLKINLEHIKTNFVGKKIRIRVASDEPVKFTNSSDVFTNFS